MTEGDSNPKDAKKVSNKKKLLIPVILIGLLAGGIGVYYYYEKHTVTKVGVFTSPAVCDDSLVERYNTATTPTVKEGSEDISIDKDGLKNLSQEIVTKPANDQDPTCQTILFWVAFRERDYETAKKAHDKISELHKKRIFADSNIRGNAPLTELGYALKSISPDATKNADEEKAL